MHLWVLAAVGLAACSPIDVAGGKWHCASHADCTSGFLCDLEAQTCVPPRDRVGDGSAGDAGDAPDSVEDAGGIDDAHAAPDLADAAPGDADVGPDAPGPGGGCGPLEVTCPAGFECSDGAFCASVDGGESFVPWGRSFIGCNPNQEPECTSLATPVLVAQLPPFVIERTEVTVAAYRSCVDGGGCAAPNRAFADVEVANYDAPGRDLHPVNFVSQGSAAQYCEARGARLCHPEEWERAARGDCGQVVEGACKAQLPLYPWSSTVGTCLEANLKDEQGEGCGTGLTDVVAARPAGVSPFGLHDMAGNVAEWTDEQAPDGGPPLIRGGSLKTVPEMLSMTDPIAHQGGDRHIGFRCCRALEGLGPGLNKPCDDALCAPGLVCTDGVCEGAWK